MYSTSILYLLRRADFNVLGENDDGVQMQDTRHDGRGGASTLIHRQVAV